MITVLGEHWLANAIRANIRKAVENRILMDDPRSFSDCLIWIAYDTPVKQDGAADAEAVLSLIRAALAPREYVANTRVLLSSQLPVGTCAALEAEFPEYLFAVHPENNRAAYAVSDFASQGRTVIGTRHLDDHQFYADLFRPFTKRMIFMSPESAEMVKHGLNGFLALSVTYANELARLAAAHGANASDVAEAIMSDKRIGHGAYLRPGPQMGPHLMREVHNLIKLGGGPLIQAMVNTDSK